MDSRKMRLVNMELKMAGDEKPKKKLLTEGEMPPKRPALKPVRTKASPQQPETQKPLTTPTPQQTPTTKDINKDKG